jgi:hypothetical protein
MRTPPGVRGGKIDYFAIAVTADPKEALQPADAQIIGPDGAVLKLTSRSTLDDLKRLIAVEPSADADDEEIVAVCEVGQHRLEAEATPTGQIKRVNYW